MQAECLEKLAAVVASPQYASLVRQLIVQGLVKIEEQVVEVQCRQEDKAIVTRVVSFSLYFFWFDIFEALLILINL